MVHNPVGKNPIREPLSASLVSERTRPESRCSCHAELKHKWKMPVVFPGAAVREGSSDLYRARNKMGFSPFAYMI